MHILYKEYSKDLAQNIFPVLEKNFKDAVSKGALTVEGKKPVGEGTFEVIATNEALDRDGEIIKVSGWDFGDFMKNPILLFGHNYWEMKTIIGAVTEIEIIDGNVVARGVFARTEEGQMARQLYEDAILKTVSVGFIPLERQGNVITRAKLLELSFVPVPSNPEALSLQKSLEKKMLFLKTVVAEHTPEKVDENTEWDASAAEKRIEEWATVGEGDAKTIDWERYGSAFAWYDSANPEEKGSYKLPHHDIMDGKLVTVWRGVATAMSSILSARSGMEIPEGEIQGVYSHLSDHYKQFDKEPPELKGYTQYELDNMFGEDGKAKQVQVDDSLKSLLSLKQDVLSLIDSRLPSEYKGPSVQLPEDKEKTGVQVKGRHFLEDAIKASDALATALKELVNANQSPESEQEKAAHATLLKNAQQVDKLAETIIVAIKNMAPKTKA